jgi:hypothetical protein
VHFLETSSLAYEWTLLGELGFYIASLLELVRKICNLLVLLACFIVLLVETLGGV